MIGRALVGSAVLAILTLAGGYALLGRADALLIVGAGVVWLIAERRRSAWPASIAFIFFVGMAGRGLWLGIQPVLALLSVVAVLSAWDLAYFRLRLQGVQAGATECALEQQHLWRLLLADVVSVALGGVALGLRIRLGLGSALVLGMLAVIGLSQAIRFLRRNSE